MAGVLPFPRALKPAAYALAIFITLALRGFSAMPRRNANRSLIMAYLPAESIYDEHPFFVKTLITSGSAERLDQINYSAGSITKGQCALGNAPADVMAPYAAQNSVNGIADNPTAGMHGYFHQLQELKHRYPRLKILISLEGRASDFAYDAKPENRSAFVTSCMNVFVRGQFLPGMTAPGLFDGFDIDWETPRQDDAANFKALLEEFRRQMNAIRPGLRLSIAVDQAPQRFAGTDFAALAPIVDQFAVMNYDYAGPWSRTTGFIAPLFASSAVDASIGRSIASYRAAGVPASKILMGLPFYGYGWTDVAETDHGLFQTGRPMRGDWSYSSIHAFVTPSQVFRDRLSQAPWIYDGKTFWTYEDATSIHYKVSYAASQHLGGVMIWDLSGDTAEGELLRAVYLALHHPLKATSFAQPKFAAEPAREKGQ